MPRRLFLILLIWLFAQKLTAQSADTTLSPAVANAIHFYYQSLKEESPLYNGSEYLEYSYMLQEGHPFYGSPEWTDAIVSFDGMIFHNVPLMYDIIKDQVVIRDFQKLFKINLMAEKIDWFQVSGHTFVHLGRDSPHELRPGFYEQLFSGNISLFARRQKKILEKHIDVRIENIVITQNTFLILKNAHYAFVKNKADLFHVLKDKKKEIQQYLKKGHVKFKDGLEKAILIAVQHYDQLMK